MKITCGLTLINRSFPLGSTFYSAMKNAGRESVDALFPTLSTISPTETE